VNSIVPKITIRHIRNLFVLFAIAAVAFIGGVEYSGRGGTLGRDLPTRVTVNRNVPENVDFAQFWKIWDTLKTAYYDPGKISEKELVYGAIKGMVSAVGDPYTVFLTPSEQKVTQEDLSGNFDGIGIQIGYKGRDLAVIAPLPGTPADTAGIRSGDLIAAIKDEAKDVDKGTDGLSLPEAVQIIRGPAGSKITLALVREGEDKPILVEVTRKTINVPSITLKYVGDGTVAHLRILKFGGETKAEWDKAVQEIVSKNTSTIILDVRNNPGGYLQAAVDIASEFLSTGTEVVYEESNGIVLERLKTTRAGKLTDRKMIILVNKGSASASEILAGALRDQKGVKLVGEKSFGKGTVQEPRELENGTGLHITIAKWLTPKGTWVHDNGLTPDTEVKDDTETEEDEQLQEALKLINL